MWRFAAEILGQRDQHILEQRLAVGTRLLAAIKDGYRPGRRRQGGEQRRRRPRPEQAHLQETNLIAVAVQMVDGLLHRLGTRTHQNDDALGIGRADVVEQSVLAPGQPGKLVHILLDNARESIEPWVLRFAGLKEDIGIL